MARDPNCDLLSLRVNVRVECCGFYWGFATMTGRDRDYTLKIAELAIEKIKSLELPADPRSFELWYAYMVGRYTDLIRRINSALDANGTLSVADIDAIYDEFFSQREHVERVGTKVSGEIDRIVEMLHELIVSTSESRADCSDASRQLALATDPSAVRATADALIKSLRAVELKHAALEQRLSSSKKEMDVLKQSMAVLSVEATVDPVTALVNRRRFDSALEQAIGSANASKQPLSLMMVDIDHFKRFNDRFGHLVGDSVLSLVGMVLKKSIKGQDTAARFGGEEFAVILPNTALHNAATLAEQIRTTIMSRELRTRGTGQNLGTITVSIGLAGYQHDESARALIERADACLYEAKRAGRNRTCSDIGLREMQGQSDTSASLNGNFSAVIGKVA